MLAALRVALGAGGATAVQQLVTHLGAVPAVLVAREGWQLSLTHAGDQPITLLPEQLQVRVAYTEGRARRGGWVHASQAQRFTLHLRHTLCATHKQRQEEVTVAMQYYQQLLECCTGHAISNSSSSSGGGGGSIAAAAARIIPPAASTKPLREAYFAALEDFVKHCMAATDHLRPPPGAAGAGSSAAAAAAGDDSSSSRPARRPGLSAAAAAAILGRESLEDLDIEAEGTLGSMHHAPGSSGSNVLRLVLSDDVKLLLICSNLSYLREKLVGSLTQRFLLVLTGVR